MLSSRTAKAEHSRRWAAVFISGEIDLSKNWTARCCLEQALTAKSAGGKIVNAKSFASILCMNTQQQLTAMNHEMSAGYGQDERVLATVYSEQTDETFLSGQNDQRSRRLIYTLFEGTTGNILVRKESSDNDVKRDRYVIVPSQNGASTDAKPFELFLPGDCPRLLARIEYMLKCEIPAQVYKQSWHQGRIIELTAPHAATVNIAPALANISRYELLSSFGHRKPHQGDRSHEELVYPLLPAELQAGPYRVLIEERDVVNLVAALNGMPDAFDENDRVLDIEPWMWDDFCSAVKKLHADKPSQRSIEILGHHFSFTGEPGGVCQIQSTWAYPIEDNASRVAHHTVEACVLAAYSSGALFRDGSFDPKVVEAFETALDQIPALIEDEEEDPKPASAP